MMPAASMPLSLRYLTALNLFPVYIFVIWEKKVRVINLGEV